MSIDDLHSVLDPGGAYQSVIDGIVGPGCGRGAHHAGGGGRPDRAGAQPDHRQRGGRGLRRATRRRRRPCGYAGLRRGDAASSEPDPVIAIAHRGDPIGHRENTLPAFAAAVAQGADMLELDLRRTRDGAIVVLHDQSLLRLWELDASVGDLDLAEVARLGEGDVRIPTLRQVLDAVPPEVELMVDFTRREVVAGALDQALAADALDRCLFVTGNVEALRLLRGLSGGRASG